MSQPQENSHAWTITIVSVLAVPVLYVALLFGSLSYATRHPAWGTSRPAEVIESFYAWLPQTTRVFLEHDAWPKIDPYGHVILVSPNGMARSVPAATRP